MRTVLFIIYVLLAVPESYIDTYWRQFKAFQHKTELFLILFGLLAILLIEQRSLWYALYFPFAGFCMYLKYQVENAQIIEDEL